MKKSSKILDALMKAFKAKDAAEVEELAKQVADEGEMGKTDENGDTHIHIHNGSSEPVGELTADEEEPAGRAKFTDDDIQEHMDKNATEHAEMFSRIEELEKLVAKLAGGTEDEGEEFAEQIADEVPEEFKEEAAKAKDSVYLADSFQDTVAMAEILVPGIRVPTFDRAAKPGSSFKAICGLRRTALDLAYGQPATRGLLDELLGGKALDTKAMTCDAARTLFRSAAALKRTANKSVRTGDIHGTEVKQAGPMTLAEINRRNAERYKS